MAESPLIRLVDIRRKYAGHVVLEGITLDIAEGEAVALLGPNGSGKSTLLKTIAGLAAPDGGTREARIAYKDIGFVPDRPPKLRFTAKEYLRAMGEIRGMDKRLLEERVGGWLERLRLMAQPGRQMKDYSKGMLQKVNLMQAMLGEPILLLLDEPLSGLDPETQEELARCLAELKAQGTTLVFSTHERMLVERIADRVVALSDGRIGSIRPARREERPRKRIVFRLREPSAYKLLDAIDGVRLGREPSGTWNASVEAGRSDDCLRAILQAGGSIHSVENEGKEMMEESAPGATSDRTAAGGAT